MERTLFDVNDKPANSLIEIPDGELRIYRIAYAQAVRDITFALRRGHLTLNSDYIIEGIGKRVISENLLYRKCGDELARRDGEIPF